MKRTKGWIGELDDAANATWKFILELFAIILIVHAIGFIIAIPLAAGTSAYVAVRGPANFSYSGNRGTLEYDWASGGASGLSRDIKEAFDYPWIDYLHVKVKGPKPGWLLLEQENIDRMTPARMEKLFGS